MPIYRSGDTVTVKEGHLRGQNLKVVEVKGSVLLLEGLPSHRRCHAQICKKVPSGLVSALFIRVLLVV